MADLLDRTARQVRPGTGQGPIHRLVSNRFDRRQGRLYSTRCNKVLTERHTHDRFWQARNRARFEEEAPF